MSVPVESGYGWLEVSPLSFDILVSGSSAEYAFLLVPSVSITPASIDNPSFTTNPLTNYQVCEVKTEPPVISDVTTAAYIDHEFTVDGCSEAEDSFCGVEFTHTGIAGSQGSFDADSLTYTVHATGPTTELWSLTCSASGLPTVLEQFLMTATANEPTCTDFLSGLTFPITVL